MKDAVTLYDRGLAGSLPYQCYMLFFTIPTNVDLAAGGIVGYSIIGVGPEGTTHSFSISSTSTITRQAISGLIVAAINAFNSPYISAVHFTSGTSGSFAACLAAKIFVKPGINFQVSQNCTAMFPFYYGQWIYPLEFAVVDDLQKEYVTLTAEYNEQEEELRALQADPPKTPVTEMAVSLLAGVTIGTVLERAAEARSAERLSRHSTLQSLKKGNT